MRLYFAHNFDNRHEFREWELGFEERTGIDLLNPFYDAPEKAEQMARLDAEGQTSRDRLDEIMALSLDECRNIVYSDLSRLACCDGLFTVIEKVSFGTTCEICNCKSIAKPVFVVTEKYAAHPWLRVYADHIFPSVAHFEIAITEQRGEMVPLADWTNDREYDMVVDFARR
jgi:hypothetical protein